MVEGTLAATVSAASGADIDKVIFDAMHALEAKREQLGLPSSDTEISDSCPAYDEEARSLAVVIKNRNGLHVRPASRLVYTLSTFNADMLLEKNGKCVTPESINQIALLQVRYNDTLRLIAKGPEAEEALIAFRQWAKITLVKRRKLLHLLCVPFRLFRVKPFIINRFYVRYRPNQP
ncbi:HPr family phosphocarrier protein [Escherichia coli]